MNDDGDADDYFCLISESVPRLKREVAYSNGKKSILRS